MQYSRQQHVHSTAITATCVTANNAVTLSKEIIPSFIPWTQKHVLMESTVQDWRLIEINHVCFYYALQYWFISSRNLICLCPQLECRTSPGRDWAGISWSLMWLSRALVSRYTLLQACNGHGILLFPEMEKTTLKADTNTTIHGTQHHVNHIKNLVTCLELLS